MKTFLKISAFTALLGSSILNASAQSTFYREPTRDFYKQQYATGVQPPRTVQQPEISAYDDYGRPNPDAFDWTGFSLGAGFGTLGFGVDATYLVLDWFNVRGAAHLFALTYKDTIDNVDYNFDFDFNGIGLMLDFYPGQKRGFRLTAGGMFNDHSTDIKGTARNAAKTTYSGSADYDSFAPYFGLGFGNPVQPDAALTFTFDLGLMIQGYDLTLPTAAAAARSDIEDVLDKATTYPVMMFALHYHF